MTAWPRPEPYRVHYYDKRKRGTWIQYFEVRSRAETFAAAHTLWGLPCKVEERPLLEKVQP